ncbi:6-carboxytetrahydropterin synthase [Silvibacterium sp.]|uniref:6-carboxytetrahydropterin synthase n=1 Tax=Silvibacterium sp. TaxID=1964179 RepID=UPI0039E3A906
MKAYFGRRYMLSASHRLHSEHLSAEQNRATYGKCNNPHGHGHNYFLEIVVGGPLDEVTGMVCDLVELDACVRREVIEVFDHTNLNLHEDFRDLVPTTENFNIVVHRRLTAAFPLAYGSAEIASVRIEETSNNSFEFPVPAPGTAQGFGKGSAA